MNWPCTHCKKPLGQHDGSHDYVPLIPKFALSLYAPWNYAILRLGKDVENRSRGFIQCMRQEMRGGGWFWLHSSKGPARKAFDSELLAMCQTAIRAGSPAFPTLTTRQLVNHWRGHIVGIANYTSHIDSWLGTPSPWWVPGQAGLRLGERYELPKPIPAKGAQGFWSINDETKWRLAGVLTEAA